MTDLSLAEKVEGQKKAEARIRRIAERWLADPEVRAKMAEQKRAAFLRAKGEQND